MFKTFYITTTEVKSGRKHHYRMTPQEAAEQDWAEEQIADVKEAGTFKFSEIINRTDALILGAFAKTL